MNNLIGQSLGRYHILEQLGEGGMAIVYKAFDTRLQIDVAVKVIRSEMIAGDKSGKSVKRFEREARALAKLNHPNIVKVTDFGEHEGNPYLVMPLLLGGTLKNKLGKPFAWNEAATLLLPIARALAYAHKKGIIHRDVKPSNIILVEDGDPMLTDFGVAKLLEVEETVELTGTGVGIGTPEYMAPEQGMGQRVDQRADIYSLGVIFYEMVTGRKPYRADTPMAVLYKQMTDPLPRPSQFVSKLPQAVERLIFKVLNKAPEERFQSMLEFAAAFEALLDGKTKSAKPTPVSHLKKENTGGLRPAFFKPHFVLTIFVAVLIISLIIASLPSLLKISAAVESNPEPTLRLAVDPSPSGATSTLAGSNSPIQTQIPTQMQIPAFQPGKPLYLNNFDQGQGLQGFQIPLEPNAWKTFQDNTNNKMLVYDNSKEDTGASFALFGDPTWSNYRLEYKIKFETRDPNKRFGFSFNVRWTDPDTAIIGPNRYQIYFNENGGEIERENQGRWTNLDHLSRRLTPGQWYTLRLDAYRETLELYIDGDLLTSLDDSDPLLQGGIAFASEDKSSAIVMYIDNIIVTELVPAETTRSEKLTALSNEILDDKGISMMLIPEGEFIMGLTTEQAAENCQLRGSVCSPDWFVNYDDTHMVFLDAFYIDKFEVTNSAYRACVDAGNCEPPKEISSATHEFYYTPNSLYENYPVVNVNWEMANTYCTWRGVRLPTEAEWEKAARGTDGRIYPPGNEMDATFANILSSVGEPTAVGSYEKGKSPYGVYDMAGNVSEWTADWYSEDYYLNSPASNPTGPISGESRVLKGDSWTYERNKSYRSIGGHMDIIPQSFSTTIGFRCAQSAELFINPK